MSAHLPLVKVSGSCIGFPPSSPLEAGSLEVISYPGWPKVATVQLGFYGTYGIYGSSVRPTSAEPPVSFMDRYDASAITGDATSLGDIEAFPGIVCHHIGSQYGLSFFLTILL
jgi:hypothetical protein